MATASSCRRIGTTAERLGYASTGTKAVRLEGFERYRLIYKGECQEKYFSLDRKWRRIA